MPSFQKSYLCPFIVIGVPVLCPSFNTLIFLALVFIFRFCSNVFMFCISFSVIFFIYIFFYNCLGNKLLSNVIRIGDVYCVVVYGRWDVMGIHIK